MDEASFTAPVRNVHETTQRTGPCQTFLAYSSENRTRLRIRVGGFGKRRDHTACTIAVMTTPSRQARLYTRRLRNTQRLQSRPGRRADGFTRSAAAPGEDTTLPRPAHWRSDDSPIGSRRTRPTTGCFSCGSQARMPYACRR